MAGTARIGSIFLSVLAGSALACSSSTGWLCGDDQLLGGLSLLQTWSLLQGRQRELPSRDGRTILWVHLHNTGGSMMCRSARTQGEKCGPNNCNLEGDCVSAPEEHRISCSERLTLSHTHTFTALERELTDADINCEGILYGTMLRDPLALARSTFVNNEFRDSEKQELLLALRNGMVPKMHRNHTKLPEWDTYQHFDNFATRVFSGHYMLAPGMVTRVHLEMAKSSLRKMDVVLILENFAEQLVQLRHKFGWDTALLTPQEKVNSHSESDLYSAFTPAEEGLIKECNELDFELYEFGRSLAANRTAAALAATSM